jgi:uncharacterized protein YycO
MKIALFKSNGFFYNFIKFFTKGEYTHAGIFLNDGRLAEVKPFHKVAIEPDVYFNNKCGTVVELYNVEMTPEQEVIVMDFITNQLGKSYDYWTILGFVFYKTDEGRKSYGKWFCSELVFAAFEKAGIKLLERANAWNVSPVMLSYSNKIDLDRIVYV